MIICPNCLAPVKFPLPVEPLYRMDVAAMLIPVKLRTLQTYLQKHKEEYPPRYALMAAEGRKRPTRHRMLSASEIRRLRSHLIRPGKAKAFVTRERR